MVASSLVVPVATVVVSDPLPASTAVKVSLVRVPCWLWAVSDYVLVPLLFLIPQR